MKRRKKVLIALDESSHSVDIIKFVAENRFCHEMDLTLFHVFVDLPLFIQDAEGAFAALLHEEDLERVHRLKEQELLAFMDKNIKMLVTAGMNESNIHIKLADKVTGIARDILAEATSGYDLVMIGRRGMSKLMEIFMGSVSAKVLEKCDSTPLMIMGSCQPLRNICIAFDGSDCSMNAVKFAGDTMGRSEYPVHLINVLRCDEGTVSKQVNKLLASKSWFEEAEKSIKEKMEIAKEYLIDSGIPNDKISFHIVKDAHSRAGSIIEEIRKVDSCVILLGRRGLSKVEEFVMGRVSNKVIQMAKTDTVFVIPEKYNAKNK